MIIRGRAVRDGAVSGLGGTLCLVLSRFVTRTAPTGTVPPEGPSSTAQALRLHLQAAGSASRLSDAVRQAPSPGVRTIALALVSGADHRLHTARAAPRGAKRAPTLYRPASYRTCTHVHRSPGESRSDCRPVSPHANRTPSRPEPPTPRVPSCEPSALSPSAYPPPFLSAFASAAPVCSAPFSHIGPPSARWKYASWQACSRRPVPTPRCSPPQLLNPRAACTAYRWPLLCISMEAAEVAVTVRNVWFGMGVVGIAFPRVGVRVPRAQILSFISTPVVAEDCATGFAMVVVGMAFTMVLAFFPFIILNI